MAFILSHLLPSPASLGLGSGDPEAATGWAWWGTRLRVLSCFCFPGPLPAVILQHWFSKWDPKTNSINIPLNCLLGMQVLQPYPRPPESDTLGGGGGGAAMCVLKSPPGDSDAH